MSGRGKAKETFPESAELGCPLAELGSRGSLLVPAKPGGLWNVWLITRVPQPRLGSHVGLALPEQVLGDSEGAELEAEQSSAEQSTPSLKGCSPIPCSTPPSVHLESRLRAELEGCSTPLPDTQGAAWLWVLSALGQPRMLQGMLPSQNASLAAALEVKPPALPLQGHNRPMV